MKILVIGSVSTDFVVTTTVKPKQGETVFGEAFETSFGGKGANQAVAASRLDAKVEMAGCVGPDLFGEEIIENLQANSVDTSNIAVVPQAVSGSAHITLHQGDNSIVVIPGANNEMTLERVSAIKENILSSDFVIIQNEIPQKTNEAIIEWCWEKKIPLLYNPAPAREIREELLAKTTYFTPNEHEFKALFPNQRRQDILKKYPNQLIITLGAEGAVFHNGEKEVLVPAYQVTPVDTTGAGDTFNGALAAKLLEGAKLEAAIRFANQAAAISIQRFGAQGGMPTREQVRRFFESM